MTPERAREIWDSLDDDQWLDDAAQKAILAACAEERREALTEAARECRRQKCAKAYTEEERGYDEGCEMGALTCEKLRDD